MGRGYLNSSTFVFAGNDDEFRQLEQAAVCHPNRRVKGLADLPQNGHGKTLLLVGHWSVYPANGTLVAEEAERRGFNVVGRGQKRIDCRPYLN